jgi:hypothetical protein
MKNPREKHENAKKEEKEVFLCFYLGLFIRDVFWELYDIVGFCTMSYEQPTPLLFQKISRFLSDFHRN